MSNPSSADSVTPVPLSETAPPAAGAAPEAPALPPVPEPRAPQHYLRNTIALIERHPLQSLAFGAAASALIEAEFALGLLAGIGIAAALATSTGSDARREARAAAQRMLAAARRGWAPRPEPAASEPAHP